MRIPSNRTTLPPPTLLPFPTYPASLSLRTLVPQPSSCLPSFPPTEQTQALWARPWAGRRARRAVGRPAQPLPSGSRPRPRPGPGPGPGPALTAADPAAPWPARAGRCPCAERPPAGPADAGAPPPGGGCGSAPAAPRSPSCCPSRCCSPRDSF